MSDDLKNAELQLGLAEERTRLANERTFLAWIRTGLALVGGGIIIIRVLTFQDTAHKFTAEIFGGSIVLLGVIVFFLSFFDYYKSYKKLKDRDFQSILPWTIILISSVLGFISLFLLIIIFYELYFWI